MQVDRPQTEREMSTWRKKRKNKKQLWVSEDNCIEETSSIVDKRQEDGAYMEVAWSGEESECGPVRRESGGGGMQCEKSEPSNVSGKWGTSSNGKLVIYQGAEKIKYIKDNGDRNGFAREESYKYRIREKWFWIGIKDISMKYVMNLEHHFMSENKEVLKEQEECCKSSQSHLEGSSQDKPGPS